MYTITIPGDPPKTCHDCQWRTMMYADEKRLVHYCMIAKTVVNNGGWDRNKSCPINEVNYE